MKPQLKWICILIIAVLIFSITKAQKPLTVLPIIFDSARVETGHTSTKYGHEFPIYYDARKNEYYIERKVSKSGRVTRWKLKVK